MDTSGMDSVGVRSGYVSYSHSKGAEQNDAPNKFKAKPALAQQPSVHQMISPDDDEDGNSSIDENLEIESITSSIEDQLT